VTSRTFTASQRDTDQPEHGEDHRGNPEQMHRKSGAREDKNQ
jgi:hypothetical protein